LLFGRFAVAQYVHAGDRRATARLGHPADRPPLRVAGRGSRRPAPCADELRVLQRDNSEAVLAALPASDPQRRPPVPSDSERIAPRPPRSRIETREACERRSEQGLPTPASLSRVAPRVRSTDELPETGRRGSDRAFPGPVLVAPPAETRGSPRAYGRKRAGLSKTPDPSLCHRADRISRPWRPWWLVPRDFPTCCSNSAR